MLTTQQLRIPLWNTDIVYTESILMLKNADGAAAAPLLYNPITILKVENLSKGETYTESRDWVFRDGKLTLTPDSRIFAFTEQELYPEIGEEGHFFPMPAGNLLFHEGSFFIDRQISVTYTCKPGEWSGVTPSLADKALPRTFELLRGGKPFNLLLFGDSISAGANNTKGLGIPPYQPDYGEMLYQWLSDSYSSEITYTNTSVGGRETIWAIETADERVNAYNPDLVILAFGMNDGNKTPQEFAENNRTIIKLVREKHPKCEFILVATSLPNPLLTDPRAKFWGYQEKYKSVLDEIAADTAGIAVADISGVHRYLLTRKRFIDLTSNNVNHPNDFFYRFHTQFLAGMLIG